MEHAPNYYPLASPGGVAERSESFKMMIAGGNHTVIKKLLSVTRLMRGGESQKVQKILVEWCKAGINTIHPAAFMNQPVAAPHQS